jgi:hypothetical protein
MTQGPWARPQNGEGSSNDSPGEHGLGLMAPGEVAMILHVDANTVARWSNHSRLRAVRTPGGHRRYYTEDVLEIARSGGY